MAFYNTINLTGEALMRANARAAGQTELIKTIFQANPDKEISPSQIWQIVNKKYNLNYLLTSIRRSMTDLTTEKGGNVLVKCDTMITSPYGKPEHCWKLNKETDALQKFWDGFQNEQPPEQKPTYVQTSLL